MDTVNGERHKIELAFGYGHSEWNLREFFLRHLTQTISESFGGFRFETGTGFWRSDGNSEAPFTGELFEEDTVTVTVTVDGDPESAVSILRAACVESKRKTDGDVPMEWVNVEVTQCEAHHFKM